MVQQWGTAGDIRVPGYYIRGGQTEIAVWRLSSGTWYIIPFVNSTTFTAIRWGTNGDVPVQKPIGQ